MLAKYKSFIMYVVFGILTTAVNFISYTLCYNICDMPNVISTIIAWGMAVVFAFITNKMWVFDSKSFDPATLKHEISTFFGTRIVTGIPFFQVQLLSYHILRLPMRGIPGFQLQKEIKIARIHFFFPIIFTSLRVSHSSLLSTTSSTKFFKSGNRCSRHLMSHSRSPAVVHSHPIVIRRSGTPVRFMRSYATLKSPNCSRSHAVQYCLL